MGSDTWALPALRRTGSTVVCDRPAGGLAAVRLVGAAAGPAGDAPAWEALGAELRVSPGEVAFEVPAARLEEAVRLLAPPDPEDSTLSPRHAARSRLLARLRGSWQAGTLVVVGEVGDFSGQRAERLLKLCGPALPPGPAGPVAVEAAPLALPWEGALQAHVAIGYRVPGREDHVAWAALTVACRVLGEGLFTRLNRVLREELGRTYGFTASLDPGPGGAVLLVQGAVGDEKATKLALGILRETASHGVGAEECERAVTACLDGAWSRFESAAGLADELASLAAAGLPPEWLSGHLEALGRLDAATVSEVLGKHLVAPVVVTAGRPSIRSYPRW
ncbi:M16 family metallopeptidase [Nonomuraea sp. NPDC050328]|uniref:M16 family metallopeptidase n=1 Tax=Nonomuraea sp. NPDC050328 TaxID=3364361 RepID=UPI0037A68F47